MPPDRTSELLSRAERLIAKADATLVGIVDLQREVRDSHEKTNQHIDKEIAELKNEQLADLRREVQALKQGKAELWQAVDDGVKQIHANALALAQVRAGAYVLYTTLVAGGGIIGFTVGLVIHFWKP